MTRLLLSFSIIAISSLAIAAPAHADEIRFATFNVSLYREQAGELAAALRSGDDPQIRKVAEIIQRVDPDVLLLNEFDYDPNGKLPDLFRENYLQVSQHGQQPVRYEHIYCGPVNTGIDSGFDLDRDGAAGGAGDASGGIPLSDGAGEVVHRDSGMPDREEIVARARAA